MNSKYFYDLINDRDKIASEKPNKTLDSVVFMLLGGAHLRSGGNYDGDQYRLVERPNVNIQRFILHVLPSFFKNIDDSRLTSLFMRQLNQMSASDHNFIKRLFTLKTRSVHEFDLEGCLTYAGERKIKIGDIEYRIACDHDPIKKKPKKEEVKPVIEKTEKDEKSSKPSFDFQ